MNNKYYYYYDIYICIFLIWFLIYIHQIIITFIYAIFMY